LRCVCYAKSLQAQLQTVAFGESDRLEQRRIQVEKAGPAEKVPPYITERVCRRSSEARRGEPRIAGADPVKDLHRSNQIRCLCIARREKRGGIRIKVKRGARHKGEKAGHAPVTQNRSGKPGRDEALAPS